jgi:hypothetical protein
MSEQINSPRRYRADLVFPPWEGRLPRVLPLSIARAACEGEQR